MRFSLHITSLLYIFSSTQGELTDLSGSLAATSSSVRYITTYLVDPGSIDLTRVTFAADKSSALFVNDDDRYGNSETLDDAEMFDDTTDDTTDAEDHNINDSETNEPTSAPTVNSTSAATDQMTNKMTLKNTNISTDKLTSKQTTSSTTNENSTEEVISDDDYYENDGNDGNRTRSLAFKQFTIDLLFFREPSQCAKTKDGCDWTKLGIGNSDGLGNVRWCCSEDAIGLGLCSASQNGRMIIDSAKFNKIGERRDVLVPASGDFQGRVSLPVMTTKSGSGQYTFLMANCNDYGRNVDLDGNLVWQNKGGYLPGDLFDEWHFIVFLTFCYAALLVWYGMSMKANRDSTIGIQKWILCTISLGLLQTIFETTDYFKWNNDGVRSNGILYTWIIIGVLKGSISRCLLIMVSLGWGVIRDTLGDQMKRIVFLGSFYLLVAFLRDIAGIMFVEEIHVLSEEKEEAIYDIFTLFTLLAATVDVVVYMWILDALNGTMQYLENMNQTMKLKRYLRLRLFLLLSILFALFWTILGVVDNISNPKILAENQDWVIPAAWAVNYFFLLSSISLLWRPNPTAKEFAYVMELPSIGDDLDFDTNIGPVGIDDDDNQHSYSGGLQNNENGMRVENGVST